MMRVGRIPYVNCYPVYGAIDRDVVRIDAEIVDGVPSALNAHNRFAAPTTGRRFSVMRRWSAASSPTKGSGTG